MLFSSDRSALMTQSPPSQAAFHFEDDISGSWESAFAGWLTKQRGDGEVRQTSTVEVYVDMWGCFSKWCIAQAPSITLESLSAEDLERFFLERGEVIGQAEMSGRHLLKSVRLFQRVLAHHSLTTGATVNQAPDEWIKANEEIRWAEAEKNDQPPEYLVAAESKRFIAFLSEILPGAPGPAHGLAWQEVRNRAAAALQLGAGLTPGDVRVLRLDSLITGGNTSTDGDLPWKVAVPAHGNVEARDAPIAEWAGEILRCWLLVRENNKVCGEWLFPSTRTGNPWSKPAYWTASKALFEAADFASPEGGSFRLRHTFALRQIALGHELSKVAGWLGVKPDSMSRYDKVVFSPQQLV